jgi:penicillin-insensitive murein endopeptidase
MNDCIRRLHRERAFSAVTRMVQALGPIVAGGTLAVAVGGSCSRDEARHVAGAGANDGGSNTAIVAEAPDVTGPDAQDVSQGRVVVPPATRPRDAHAVTTTHSRSIGPPQRGQLETPATIPDDTALALMPSTIRRNARFGDEQLVAAIVRAARRVAERHPGSVLHVGDLSLPAGGSFAPHRSHTNGRDVDLAFYMADADGLPADRPVMARVDADGRVAGHGAWFDVRRNWLLLESLLRDPGVQVQWIFVARHLRERLLEHARMTGAEPLFIERAATVMAQPRDSSPHDDHYHVRVYCSRNDRVRGCLDAPPFHAWIDDHREAIDAWYAGIRPFLSMPGTEEFRWALDTIARNLARGALDDLEALPTPADPTDAELLSEVIDFLRGRGRATRWETLRPADVAP